METNDRVLQRIRALLAKAESTTYPDEAAALTAKAQELIAGHAIDLALIEEQTGRGEVTTRVIFIPAPYPKEKFLLLGGVARANGCRAILGLDHDVLQEMIHAGDLADRKGRYATVVGYSSDLDSIELLFTSLLVQAVNVMLAHGTQVDAWGDNRTRSFRRSFLNSFAWTVRERLAEARDSVGAAADASAPGSVLPVLASREDDVEDFVTDRFPSLGTLRTSVSNASGVRAGQHAGRQADLGGARVPSAPTPLH